MKRKLLFFILTVFVLQVFANNEKDYKVEDHFSYKKVKTGDGGIYKLSEFTKKEKVKNDFIANETPDKFKKHPEFGYSAHHFETDAVELVHEKDKYSSKYLKPNGTTVLIKSSDSPLNYLDTKLGMYRTISNKIEDKLIDDKYKAPNQPIVKSIHPKKGNIEFELPYFGNYTYNQDVKLIYESNSGVKTYTNNRNISEYKIGENGYFANELFPGIDLQAIFLNDGPVKTNYIIKTRNSLNNISDKLIFQEKITVPMGTKLVFENPDTPQESDLLIVDNDGVELIRYTLPFIYDADYAKEYVKGGELSKSSVDNSIMVSAINSVGYINGQFRTKKIDENNYIIDIVIPSYWLLSSERKFPIVVDPITVNSNTIANLTTNNPGAGAGCVWTVAAIAQTTFTSMTAAQRAARCHTITFTVPAGYMFIGTTPQFAITSGYSTPSCAMGNTVMQYIGPCGYDPRPANFYWFCNSMFSGNCGGNTVNPTSIVSRCNLTVDGETCTTPTPPSCSDQSFSVSTCIQTRCTGTAAGNCHGTVRAWGSMSGTVQVERILLNAIASSVGVNLCPNATTVLSSRGSYGVPNSMDLNDCTNNLGGTYSYSWSQVSGPAAVTLPASGNSATTGIVSSSVTMPATTGTYVLRLTICGACAGLGAALNCAFRDISITVGTAVAPIAMADTVYQCPSTATTITLTNLIAGYTYTWTGISPVVASATGTTRGYAGLTAGTTRTVVVQATAPCPSAFDTIRIIYGTPPSPGSASPLTSPICPNTAADLFSNCTSCRWYDVASGGAILGTNPTFNTGNLATTSTFYVAEAAFSGACESARIPVTINVGNLSVAATAASGTCTTDQLNTTFAGGTTATNVSFNGTIDDATFANNEQDCYNPGIAPNGTCLVADYAQASVAVSGISAPTTASTVQRVCFTIASPACPRDLNLFLQSPDGTIVTLNSLSGSKSAAYSSGTCFQTGSTNTDLTGNPLNNAAGYQPSTGDLGANFVGEDPNGTWRLWVSDGRGGGGCAIGDLTSFSMVFQNVGTPTFSWTAVAPASTTNLSGTTISDPSWTNPNTASSYTYNVTVTDVAGCTGVGTVVIDCPLSVSWLDFKVKKEGKQVKLNWNVASEEDNDYFVIERSRDSYEFYQLDRIQSKGKQVNNTEYLYYDEQPLQGVSYYRIRQVDKNGNYTFSKVEAVDFGKKFYSLHASPNPTSSLVRVELVSEVKTDEAVLIVNDMLGRIVIKNDIAVIEGTNQITLDLSKLPIGVYTLETIVNDKKEMIKIMKEEK